MSAIESSTEYSAGSRTESFEPCPRRSQVMTECWRDSGSTSFAQSRELPEYP